MRGKNFYLLQLIVFDIKRILLAFSDFSTYTKYDHHQTFLYFSYLLPYPVKPANGHKVRWILTIFCG